MGRRDGRSADCSYVLRRFPRVRDTDREVVSPQPPPGPMTVRVIPASVTAGATTTCLPGVRASRISRPYAPCSHLDAADRGPPGREDLPLPTEPPFTAFVGNLAFDLNEGDLEQFFDGLQVRTYS